MNLCELTTVRSALGCIIPHLLSDQMSGCLLSQAQQAQDRSTTRTDSLQPWAGPRHAAHAGVYKLICSLLAARGTVHAEVGLTAAEQLTAWPPAPGRLLQGSALVRSFPGPTGDSGGTPPAWEPQGKLAAQLQPLHASTDPSGPCGACASPPGCCLCSTARHCFGRKWTDALDGRLRMLSSAAEGVPQHVSWLRLY